MNRREVKRVAKFRAGLILESMINGWSPEDLVDRYGQETVDAVSEEMSVIAERLIEQGGGGR